MAGDAIYSLKSDKWSLGSHQPCLPWAGPLPFQGPGPMSPHSHSSKKEAASFYHLYPHSMVSVPSFQAPQLSLLPTPTTTTTSPCAPHAWDFASCGPVSSTHHGDNLTRVRPAQLSTGSDHLPHLLPAWKKPTASKSYFPFVGTPWLSTARVGGRIFCVLPVSCLYWLFSFSASPSLPNTIALTRLLGSNS